MIDGFRCYAPSLAHQNDGFSSESFSRLFELERSSFWFRSRNNLIRHLLETYVGNKRADFCEIGCGTGFVLGGLASLPNLKLSGSEIHVTGLKYARERHPQVEFFQADATNLPFKEKYDAIGAFDVMEHISEDTQAMESIYHAIKPGGFFFLTVPQYSWMWSLEDDIAFHKRRYTRKELKRKLSKAGFDVEFISSFVFLLFPFMAVQRLIGKSKRNKGAKVALQGFTMPRWVDKIFYGLTESDLLLIKNKVSLPFGGSLVCVARKR